MRIGERDLEPILKNKINQFEELKNSFDKNNPDGFVSYDGNSFYIKRTNNTFLRKALSEEDIQSLKKFRYEEDALHTNSFMSDFNHQDSNNAALISHVWDINDKDKIQVSLDEEFYLMEEYNENYYIFDMSGCLTKIYNNNIIYREDIMSDIKKEFSIPNFLIFDILSITPTSEGIYITTSFGVYMFNEENKELELKFKEPNVTKLAVLDNREVFLTTKKGCYIYSTESNLKLETHNQLKNNWQIAIDIVKHGDFLFLASKSLGVNNGDKALHCWKKDDAGLSYNNIDSMIRTNSDDNSYRVKKLYVDDHNVFVGGIKDEHFFIWKYNLDYLYKPYEEIVLNKFKISDFSDFAVINNKIIVSSGTKIYVFNDDGSILYNFNLKKHIYRFKFIDDEIVAAAGCSYIRFKIPVFERKAETLVLKVYDSEPCNNIDMYISNIRDGKESIKFYNEDTMQEIIPVFYVHYHNQLIVKFLNSNASKILMRVTVQEDSRINNIVVKKNTIFLI